MGLKNQKGNKNRIKAVFFDIGGVLIPNYSPQFYIAAEKLFRIEQKRAAEIWEKLYKPVEKGQMSYAVCMRRFGAACGAEHLSKKAAENFTRVYEKYTKPYPDTLRLVKKLKKHGYITGIISNTHAEHYKINFKRGLFKNFDIVILSHRAKLIKPDPKIYRLALKRARVRPEEAVFIDDRAEMVRASRKLGMHGIVFRNPKVLRGQLQKLLTK